MSLKTNKVNDNVFETMKKNSLEFRPNKKGDDWGIYYGESLYLVIEGPGWTRSFGHQIFETVANGRSIDIDTDGTMRVKMESSK